MGPMEPSGDRLRGQRSDDGERQRHGLGVGKEPHRIDCAEGDSAVRNEPLKAYFKGPAKT
jgi:hypothetical protein